MTGIEQAIDKAGGQEELGAALRPPVTQQAISKWKAQGYAPAGRADEISKLFAIAVRDLLRPDLAKVLS